MFRRRAIAVGIGFFALTCCSPLCADDSAVSVAVGGIQPRKEVRVSMEKERLTIGLNKVAVDFDFLNEADTDVTTEVGFPIPKYCFSVGESREQEQFDDFRAWVDGRELRYQTQTRALVGDQDYAALLGGLGIDAASFGGFFSTRDPISPQIVKLSPDDKAKLVRLGLLEEGDFFPQWCVEKMYHWTQTFPAHKAIHIRHDYTPTAGFDQVSVDKLQTDLKDSCVDDRLRKGLASAVDQRLESGHKVAGRLIYPAWVDYILTSGNTWKTPIKSFELIVERPKPGSFHGNGPYSVSFCWDGKVERLGPDHFVAHLANFIPTHELRIYFLSAD